MVLLMIMRVLGRRALRMGMGQKSRMGRMRNSFCCSHGNAHTDFVFGSLGLIPKGARPPSAIEHAHIIWDYTSWLDFVALVFAAWLLFLHFRSRNKRIAHACH